MPVVIIDDVDDACPSSSSFYVNGAVKFRFEALKPPIVLSLLLTANYRYVFPRKSLPCAQ